MCGPTASSDPPCAAGETWPLLAKTTLQVQTAKRASESHVVVPEAAGEPATMASGTVAETAACWEEGATGAVAAAGSPRQVAQAVAAAPPCLGVSNIMCRK